MKKLISTFINKLKEFLKSLGILLILVFVLVTIISYVRSTNETYVCSGNFFLKDNPSRPVHVRFEIEDRYSGIPWSHYRFSSVSMMDNLPYVFYISTMKDKDDKETLFGESNVQLYTYNWTNSRITASQNNTLVSFDFKTKILNATIWLAKDTVEAEYNLLCSNIH